MDIGHVLPGTHPAPDASAERPEENETMTQASSPQDSREPSLPTRLRLAHLADAARSDDPAAGSERRDSVALTGGAPPQAGYDKPPAARGPAESGVAEETGDSSQNNRIERIRKRIEDGFYLRPDVQETIADRLAAELAAAPPDDDN